MSEIDFGSDSIQTVVADPACGRVSPRQSPLLLKNPLLIAQNKMTRAFVFAFSVGWGVWQIPATELLDARSIGFVATLAAGVVLWVSEVLDDYVVALLVFLSWIFLDIVPPEIALSGFSTKSWFFVVAALGIATTVTKSGLFNRVALQLLCRIPPTYHKTYSLLLFVSGLLATPLVPTSKARVTLAMPMVRAIIEACGYKPRSNGSAGLMLAAYLGFGQMSFMFLTGATANFAGWSLLPKAAKAEFGWVSWALAAIPLAVVGSLFLIMAVYFVFPLQAEDTTNSLSQDSIEGDLKKMGELRREEWLSIVILAMALIGWLTKSIHGISEVWVAIAAFLFALVTGALDKESLKRGVDWGFVLFFGVICSMGMIVSELQIDRWLGALIDPALSSLAGSPLAFLMATVLLVYAVRLFLRKISAVIFLMLSLGSWAAGVGIHPGVLLLTIVMACEGWFFHYQDGPYQIVYHGTQGRAFSHAQARKIMVAKFFANFFALVVSVPCWRALGLIE